MENYKKPTSSFSPKKVLANEKNGLCAIFLLFWLFDVVGYLLADLVENKPFEFKFNFWFYGAIITTIIYFILKIMKRRQMLDDSKE